MDCDRLRPCPLDSAARRSRRRRLLCDQRLPDSASVDHRVSDRRRISIRQFYVKRAVRLLPAYFFVLTIVWVLKILDGQACETLWANVLFINNFVSAERQCMPWSWSLAVEVHFYVAFPFVLLLLYRLQRSQVTCLFLILLVGVAVRGVTNLHSNQHIPIVAEPWVNLDQYIEAFNVYDKTYTRFGALVCGVIAADLYHNNGAARLPRALKGRSLCRIASCSFVRDGHRRSTGQGTRHPLDADSRVPVSHVGSIYTLGSYSISLVAESMYAWARTYHRCTALFKALVSDRSAILFNLSCSCGRHYCMLSLSPEPFESFLRYSSRRPSDHHRSITPRGTRCVRIYRAAGDEVFAHEHLTHHLHAPHQ